MLHGWRSRTPSYGLTPDCFICLQMSGSFPRNSATFICWLYLLLQPIQLKCNTRHSLVWRCFFLFYFYGVKKFVNELELIEKKDKWYLPLKPLLPQHRRRRRRSCRDHVTFNIYLTLQPTTVSRCPLKHHRRG